MSVKSPQTAKLTSSTVSIEEETVTQSDLPSSLPVVNNGPADTSHQIEGSVVKENIISLPVPPSSSKSEVAPSSNLPNSRLGAWAHPINLNSLSTSRVHSSIHEVDGRVAKDGYVLELWPSLKESQNGQVRREILEAPISKSFPAVAQAQNPQDRKEDALRFPWAAKMNPACRNLYRATEPEYLEDGTPKPDTTLAPVSDIEVSPDILLDTHNELNSVDPTPVAKVDNLITLATISVLEDMYASIASQPDSTPTDIKDTIESPVLESAQILSVTNTSTAHATSTVQKERSRIAESDLGSNKFASLITLEEEGDSTDSDKEIDSMNLLTPSGKRILRERPVKPSTKAKEMHLYSSARGRGNRGRGNRGGRG
ncbi:LOW QUALITY PROTEIN: hypothetical protein HID58_056224 [Brassica napus]|uniref:Uncharacterized protein n=1 Tax=Brassica napus TaxID=3708 RepID=A0ABQ8AMR6_BRANA|nr:LOW QUALITY PROTEIN: hypothetical protein HID58_056224 [Brassica napus]